MNINQLIDQAEIKPEDGPVSWTQLHKFAALVATAEREACASLCEAMDSENYLGAHGTECAVAIRARK